MRLISSYSSKIVVALCAVFTSAACSDEVGSSTEPRSSFDSRGLRVHAVPRYSDGRRPPAGPAVVAFDREADSIFALALERRIAASHGGAPEWVLAVIDGETRKVALTELYALMARRRESMRLSAPTVAAAPPGLAWQGGTFIDKTGGWERPITAYTQANQKVDITHGMSWILARGALEVDRHATEMHGKGLRTSYSSIDASAYKSQCERLTAVTHHTLRQPNIIGLLEIVGDRVSTDYDRPADSCPGADKYGGGSGGSGDDGGTRMAYLPCQLREYGVWDCSVWTE